MIRLRFVWGYDPLSRLIRAGEHDGDCPTHVDCVLSDGNLLGAHMQGGVVINQPRYDATSDGPGMRELYVDLPPLGLTYYTEPSPQPWEAFLRAQLGKPYDFTAIAGLALDRDWREDDSWFCSEMAAASLEKCGWLPRLSTIDHHVSPRDLLLVISGRIPVTLPKGTAT